MKTHQNTPSGARMMVNETPHRGSPRSTLKDQSLRLTVQDAELLRFLGESRPMNINDIQSVDGRNRRVLLSRLNRMLQYGLVCRPKQTPHPGVTRMPTVYALTEKGAETLAQFKTASIGVLTQKRDEPRFITDVQQARILGKFKGTLTLVLRYRSGIHLVEWEEGYLPNCQPITVGEAELQKPDAYFRIRTGQGPVEFLLVCDRSNITQRGFVRNLRAYRLWHQNRCHEQGAIPNLEILVVAASETRKAILRTEAGALYQPRRIGLSLLFACEDDLSLDCPETILDPIWQSAWSNQWQAAQFASSCS